MLIRKPVQDVKKKFRGLGLEKRGLVRFFSIVGVSALLAACSTVTENSLGDAYTQECMPERADIVDAAKWDDVQSTRISIVDGEIHPMVLYLEEKRPYIIQVRNADRIDHDLWSPEFFKQGTAIDSVQFGDKAATKGCVNGIRIKGRSVVTIRLVPVWEGRYELFNNATFLPTSTGADAVVHIVQPRIGMAYK